MAQSWACPEGARGVLPTCFMTRNRLQRDLNLDPGWAATDAMGTS